MASRPSNPADDWVRRLERRLTKLADTASKESIQALAKWIGFRRKYVKEFSLSLTNAINNPTSLEASHSNREARQWLYLQILHESILLDSGTSRWDRLAEMRESLGENCMMEVAKRGCLEAATIKTNVEGLIKQWDGLNVFGGPTLIAMIKKQLAAAPAPSATSSTTNSTSDNTSTTAASKSKSPPRSPKRARSPSPKPVSKKNDDDSKTPSPKEEAKQAPKQEEAPKPSSSDNKPSESKKSPLPSKSPKKTVVYDFESKNIPQAKVESKEFLAPCKAIATLQIARDLRNDNAVQVSSLLNALPEELKTLCEDADKQVKESGKPFELTESKARELSVKTSERLLDMDIDEQIQNVRTFIEVVEKQREARRRLILLLVRSRCQFDAKEAAEAFYSLDKIEEELGKRKDTLMDAMALEGLDFEEEQGDKKAKKKQRELAPLTWYLNEKKQQSEEPDAKRAKVDSSTEEKV